MSSDLARDTRYVAHALNDVAHKEMLVVFKTMVATFFLALFIFALSFAKENGPAATIHRLEGEFESRLGFFDDAERLAGLKRAVLLHCRALFERAESGGAGETKEDDAGDADDGLAWVLHWAVVCVQASGMGTA